MKNKNPHEDAKGLQDAYVSWESDGEDKNNAMKSLSEAVQIAQGNNSSRTRDFSNLTSNIGSRPGFRQTDFDWFRPEQAVPTKSKEIISFSRYAYRRIGLVRNSIDLMGDFACQGIRLAHRNKRIEKFFNDWFAKCNGKEVSERLCNLLFREANVVVRMRTAKIKEAQRVEMQKSIASPDMIAQLKKGNFKNNEIPWQFNFLDPLTVDVVGGPVASLTGERSYVVNFKGQSSIQLKSMLQNESNNKLTLSIPDEIKKSIISGESVELDPTKTFVLHYKKDDWQEWADPMTYACFRDLMLYERLKLADQTALDGAINKIRIFKLGNLEHKIAPTASAASTLENVLGANTGGGSQDIIWGPDIELIETSTDINNFLGEEKYRPTLMAIYACLGIPPTLTGTFGASGTTNNFMSLKTLTERLNYVRNIVKNFWQQQIKTIQDSMGFRFPASVEFDFMSLDDPASMINLLINMADRNIISDEYIQRHIKANPELENRRIATQNAGKEKVSPFHPVDKEFSLQKISLQTGIVSPSQVGLELEEQGDDLSSQQMQNQQSMRNEKKEQKNGQVGRPPNSTDKGPRKQREFKPITKAGIELWAKEAQGKIAEVVNGGFLELYSKKNMRSLSAEQFNETEKLKFEILFRLDPLSHVDEANIHASFDKSIPNDIHQNCEQWIKNAQDDVGRKLSIEEIRNIRVSYYSYFHTF